MMEPYILVKLLRATPVAFVRGRRLCHHGQFGNQHAVVLGDALRLVESGQAKLLRHLSLARLRADAARAAEP
jgi:hypothetical protein